MKRPTYKVRRIPLAKRVDVTRGEYNALVEILNERGEILMAMQKALDLQFARTAQVQAELDQIRSAWGKKPRRGHGR
jgi:hypothetical protein